MRRLQPHPLSIDEERLLLSELEGHLAKTTLFKVMVAAALIAGCTTLYSEDLQHGQLIDEQLTVINPLHTKLTFSGGSAGDSGRR